MVRLVLSIQIDTYLVTVGKWKFKRKKGRVCMHNREKAQRQCVKKRKIKKKRRANIKIKFCLFVIISFQFI